MKAELVPENGDPPIPITRDVTVIGRKDVCDVVIDDASLSKRHCVVVKTDGLLVIRDLVTTNGTKVKGQKIRWAALLPDDRIAFGAYKLRVYLGSDDVPSPSERAAAGKSAKAGSARRREGRPGPVPRRRRSPRVKFRPRPPDLEFLDDDSVDDDSGWRRLLTGKPPEDDDDVVIDLD